MFIILVYWPSRTLHNCIVSYLSYFILSYLAYALPFYREKTTVLSYLAYSRNLS